MITMTELLTSAAADSVWKETTNDRRVTVWRRRGHRYRDYGMADRWVADRWWSGVASAWVDVLTFTSCVDRPWMPNAIYMDDVLRPIVLTYAGAILIPVFNNMYRISPAYILYPYY